MANDIATHTAHLLQKFGETQENLSRLQNVTSECKHIEDLGESWLLRAYFMNIAEEQWDELSTLLIRDILPLVADISSGVHVESKRASEAAKHG